MFGTFDHLNGAWKVRLRRFLFSLQGKPDISFIYPNLGVGGVSSVKGLWECGIKAILDLRDGSQDDPIELEKYSIDYMNLKIPNRGTPDLEHATKAVNWIKSNIDQDKKVFVHCNLGRGRGPLLTVMYLISQGMKSDDAIVHVKNIRPYSFFNRKQLHWISELEKRKI